jgi:streptogramin lyase
LVALLVVRTELVKGAVMRFGIVLRTLVVVVVIVCGAVVGGASVSAAPSDGLTAHAIVTGLPTVPPGSVFAGVGPFGLVFDKRQRLLVSDAANLGFYALPRSGSSAPTPLTTGNVQTGLTWGKDGELFAARFQAGDIVQIDPASGALIRELVPSGTFPCVTGLATDPVSGDLFFGQPNSGGACPGAPGITRIEHPASAHPIFVTYSLVPGTYTIDVAFAPDGTLYAVEQGPSIACAARIAGTRSPTPPSITTLACFPNFGIFAGIDTIAISAKPRHAPTLFVAGPDGTINEIDQTTTPPTVTAIITGGTRTDGMIVGPDGCLYATQSSSIEKLTNTDGSCSLFPVRFPGQGRIG